VLATNSNEARIANLENFDTKMLRGHTGTIMAVAVHPKGFIATASKDKTLRLWDLSDRRCLAVCVGHLESVCAVQFGQRGFWFVSASRDRTIKLWRPDDFPPKQIEDEPKELRTAIAAVGHEKDVTCFAISPNDSLIASGSIDKSITIWSKDLIQITVIRGHRRSVHDCKFSPTDKILLSASGDKTLRLWSLDDYSCLRVFEGHTSAVSNCAFLNKGTQIVSAGGDGLLKLWSVKTGLCVNTFEEHEHIWCMSVSSEGQVVTGDTESVLNVWKDVTEIEKQKEVEEEAKKQVALQSIQKAMRQNGFVTAAQLCIAMDQPRRLYTVFYKISSLSDSSKQYAEVFQALESEDFCKMIGFMQDWMTNSKRTYITAELVHFILQNCSPNELAKLPWKNFQKTLKALIAYSDRHFKRVDGMLRKSYILDFTQNCMGLMDIEDVGDKRKRGELTIEEGAKRLKVQ